MSEKWIRWAPITGLAQQYTLHKLINTPDTLSIILINKEVTHKVVIIFSRSVSAFARSAGSYHTQVITTLHTTQGKRCNNWSFFTIQNSPYLAWLDAESYHVWNVTAKFTHFAWITATSIIDVATTYEPSVEIRPL